MVYDSSVPVVGVPAAATGKFTNVAVGVTALGIGTPAAADKKGRAAAA